MQTCSEITKETFDILLSNGFYLSDTEYKDHFQKNYFTNNDKSQVLMTLSQFCGSQYITQYYVIDINS